MNAPVDEGDIGASIPCEGQAPAEQPPVYRIDLGGVVSKYIGETEKNLRRVLAAVEWSGALLCIDEVDVFK